MPHLAVVAFKELLCQSVLLCQAVLLGGPRHQPVRPASAACTARSHSRYRHQQPARRLQTVQCAASLLCCAPVHKRHSCCVTCTSQGTQHLAKPCSLAAQHNQRQRPAHAAWHYNQYKRACVVTSHKGSLPSATMAFHI
jgi:hypothetical protein